MGTFFCNLMETLVRPVMLFGCEVWKIKKAEDKKIKINRKPPIYLLKKDFENMVATKSKR